MSLHKLKKALIITIFVVTGIITFHLAIVVVGNISTGHQIFDPPRVAIIALLMGLQCLALAIWCYDHVRREERVLEMYPEVRRG